MVKPSELLKNYMEYFEAYDTRRVYFCKELLKQKPDIYERYRTNTNDMYVLSTKGKELLLKCKNLNELKIIENILDTCCQLLIQLRKNIGTVLPRDFETVESFESMRKVYMAEVQTIYQNLEKIWKRT